MIHLHGHSHYSLLEAIGSPKNIVQKVKQLGMSAVGLTDYNGMYGIVEFYQECKKEDIKAILGVELGLVYNRTKKENERDTGNIVLIAQNYQGYKNLMDITSHANLDGYRGRARIDREILEKYSGNLMALMGGEKSFLGKMIIYNENIQKIQEIIARLNSIFDSHFYLELIAQDENKLLNTKRINKTFLHLSQITKTHIICQTNYHYIHPQDKESAEVALAIKDGKRIFDNDRRKIIGDYHITSENEVKEMMKNNGYDMGLIQEALDRTDDIAQSLQVDLPLGKILFPKYKSGEKIKKEYEKVKDKLVMEEK